MGHFFFHFCTESERHADDTGLELASIEAAYLQAVAAAYGMAGDLLVDGIDAGRCSFEITDANGTALLTLPFAELLRADRGEPRMGQPMSDLALALETTHRRVTSAKRDLASSIDQARAALVEAQLLVRRLNTFGHTCRKQTPL